MLLNNLFTYEQIEGNSLSFLKFRIYIKSRHVIFTGHFPGNPITPGVCQMEMVKEIFGDYLGESIVFKYVSDMKFINMWVPNDSKSVYMDLSASSDEGGYKMNASIYTGKEVYFKIRGSIHVCE